MEKEKIQVVASEYFKTIDLSEIHSYGYETFGVSVADFFISEILDHLALLETHSLMFPECRHLATKSQKYRNIILGSYLIIYRITPKRIEVLRAIHGSQSPKVFKQARSIKIK